MNFLCCSIGISYFFNFFINFPCYSMGILHFFNFPCYSMETWGSEALAGGGNRRTYVRTDVRMDVWKFTPVSYRTSALWGRCPKRIKQKFKEFFQTQKSDPPPVFILLIRQFSLLRHLGSAFFLSGYQYWSFFPSLSHTEAQIC